MLGSGITFRSQGALCACKIHEACTVVRTRDCQGKGPPLERFHIYIYVGEEHEPVRSTGTGVHEWNGDR